MSNSSSTKALILTILCLVLQFTGSSAISCSQPITVNVDGHYRQFSISSLVGDQILNLNHKSSERGKVKELRFNVCSELHQEFIKGKMKVNTPNSAIAERKHERN